jgi:hypothetical protein
MFKLKQFTTSDDYDIFEAYEGLRGPHDKWDVALFTREQVEKYLTGNTFRFEGDRLIWYDDPGEPRGTIIPAQAITTDKGESIQVYEVPGEFLLAEDLECDECGENSAHFIMTNKRTLNDTPMCQECAHENESTHTITHTIIQGA